MPVLKNPRRERLAQLLASGKSATDAYELAGYKRNGGNGPAMARTAEIKDRVTEINEGRLEQERKVQAIATERCAVTRQSLIEKAQEICAKAIEAGQLSAATAAVKEIGVLSGIRIERSERGQPGEFEFWRKCRRRSLRLMRWASWWCRTSRSGCIEPYDLGRSLLSRNRCSTGCRTRSARRGFRRLRQPLDKGVATHPKSQSIPMKRDVCHLK